MNILAVSNSFMQTSAGRSIFGEKADQSYWRALSIRLALNLACFLVSSLEVDLLDFIGFVGGLMIFLISFFMPVGER